MNEPSQDPPSSARVGPGAAAGPFSLALDCSTSRGSVALADGAGHVCWETEFAAGRGRGGDFFTALEKALAIVRAARLDDAGASRSLRGELRDIIVGIGPGSYSGVRQAIAAAGGLATATGARLSGLPSIVALETRHPFYQALGDARRGAWYYTAVNTRVCARGPELLLSNEALAERLHAKPDWPVLAVEDVPPGLPAGTPIAFPLAALLFSAPPSTRIVAPLEPIYLRAPSVTLPKQS